MSPWSPESILFGIGAAIMALDQALSNATAIKARFPNLTIPVPLKFAPLILWLAALGFWWFRPASLVTPATATVVEGVNLKQILEMRAERTRFEYDRLVEPFIGAPVTIRGSVEDLSQSASGIAVVRLSDTPEGYAVDLDFKKDASTPVFRMQRGSSLSAKCEFDSMGTTIAFMRKCELSPSP